MLSALIFYTFLFLALAVIPAGLILAVLLFLEHKRKLWQGLLPLIGPIGVAMAQRPWVHGLQMRFPRTAVFLHHRLDRHNPWGLPWTLACIGMLVGVWFFLGVMQDIVAKDPLVVLDLRLHNAVPLFRGSTLTWFMLALTELGSSIVLSLLCLGLATMALARQLPRLAATFMLALAGPGLVSVALKAIFGFARPHDAIVGVHEASFPSGHMLSSAVVYGLLAALLLGSRVHRGPRAVGVMLLLLVIVGIGLSRLYLGVHWPSDLLGSLALALMALALLLFFLHYGGPVPWVDSFKLPWGRRALQVAGSTLVLLALVAAAVLTSRTKIIPAGPPAAARLIDLQALRTSLPPDLARWSEDIVGGRMEPISLVFIGTEAELVAAFRRAGWLRADLPTPLRVVREAMAALQNQPDPTGPATPAFVANQPQAITFEKPDAGAPSIRRRHHTRLWTTAYCLAPSCRPVWVATASFDVGMELSPLLHIPTHRIDTAIDDERALIVADLTRVGARQEANVAVSPALRGMNAAGDPFTTDGRAVLLVLP